MFLKGTFHSFGCIINVCKRLCQTGPFSTLPQFLFFEGSSSSRICLRLSPWEALLSKCTRLHREDLTLKFLQMIRVARRSHCSTFFVVAYSYPNCEVLFFFNASLISSHIFMAHHPLLDPSFTSRGKDRTWMGWEEFGQLLERLTIIEPKNSGNVP